MSGWAGAGAFDQGSAAADEDFVRATIAEVLARVDQTAVVDPVDAGCKSPSKGLRGGRGDIEAEDAEPGDDQQEGDEPDKGGAHASRPHDSRLDPSLLELPGNSDGTVRLLKARVRALEGQLQAALDAGAAKGKALAEAERESKALAAEKTAWAKAERALQAQVERHKRAAETAKEALAASEAKAKEQEKEQARASSGRRAAEQEARAREARLARALEEVGRYKALLEEVKAQARGGQDVARADHQRLQADHAKLERQRNQLMVAFRKQLRLIDVLRRQKAHLEAARCLAFTEEEFMKVLETGQ